MGLAARQKGSAVGVLRLELTIQPMQFEIAVDPTRCRAAARGGCHFFPGTSKCDPRVQEYAQKDCRAAANLLRPARAQRTDARLRRLGRCPGAIAFRPLASSGYPDSWLARQR